MADTGTTKKGVYAFIDGQNLHHSILEQGWKLDHRRFRKYLSDKLGVSKAFYFLGRLPSQSRLYDNLRNSGYTLIFKKTLVLASGDVKGNVDAELILNAMIQLHNYSEAVIVAGDGDYYCLLEYLQKINKLCRLVIPDKHKYSRLLRKFGNKRLFVSELRNRLEYHPQKK